MRFSTEDSNAQSQILRMRVLKSQSSESVFIFLLPLALNTLSDVTLSSDDQLFSLSDQQISHSIRNERSTLVA